jgi:MFS family permease
VSHPRDRRSPRITRGLRRGGDEAAAAARRARRGLAALSPEGRALNRLAWVHGTSAVGDALVAVALAGTLFFSAPLAAARPRVALYLLITVAPFAVVAPLLGRVLDGHSGASRAAMTAALLLRGVLAWVAAPRLDSLLLYPLAFGLLVCSRVHGITRSALVPDLVGAGRALVPINSRMARIAAVGGTLGALLGVAVHKLFGGPGVLRAGALVFLLGAALAPAIPVGHARAGRESGGQARAEPGQQQAQARGADPAPPPRPGSPRGTWTGERAGTGNGEPAGAAVRWPANRVRLARLASAGIRAAGGFVLFLLAFALRRRGVSTAGLGLLLAGLGLGSVAGAFVVPRIARAVGEEGLLALGLAVSAATSLLLASRISVATAALAGLVMGGAAAGARLGFESLVQRDVPMAIRGSTITRSETLFQLSWVLGAVLPVALPLPPDPALLALGVLCALAAAVYLVGLVRRRNGALPQAP